jgi:predicted transposase YbfD/YdcC
VPALSSSPVADTGVELTPVIAGEPVVPPPSAEVPERLLDVLNMVADPRKPRGCRFTLASILATALAATIAGAQSFSAIAEWAADAPAAVLARLGLSEAAPSEKTFRRVLQLLDADSLDTVLSAWMWLQAKAIGGVTVISFDGKTVRGARNAAGKLTHLLAGICQSTGVILAQIGVDGKTSEVPVLRKLLKVLQIAGCVITADAAHTCRETAQDIIDAGAHYVLTVKANQPQLRKRCKALPWKRIPVLDRSTGKRRHGRRETRTLQAAELDTDTGIGFPGAVQVLRVTRIRTVSSKHRKSWKQTRETVFVVTSLSAYDADHQQIADWLRGHWQIENAVHHVRDVTFDEDRSQIRTGTAPQVMATLRNTVLSLLRLTGHTNIAKACRWHARDFNRPVELVLTC